MDARFTLYGTEVSLYSGKTRAYLRWKAIPFVEQLSTLAVYRQIIVPNIGRRVIPVVRTPEGDYLQDTTAIIDALEARFPEPSVYPAGPTQRLVSLLFELYGDEWLVMPAMHYRWQRKRQNLRFILGEFGRTMRPQTPRVLQPVLGLLPATVFGGLYSKYFGIGKTMHAAVERSYQGFLDDFNLHLTRHDFLLGARPTIGDFGLIGPLYAHLYRDPAPGAMMRERAPQVARWVERMRQPAGHTGPLLADDRIPQTLMPLLARLFREQMPVLTDTVRAVQDWCLTHPDAMALPRVIGRHPFVLEGQTGERAIQPYGQWMFQRPALFYQTLSDTDRAAVDRQLADIEGIDALDTPIPTRLAFEGFRIVRAT